MGTSSGIVTQRRFSLIHVLVFLLAAGGIIGTIWWFFAFTPGANQIESQLKNAEVVSWASTPGENESVGAFSPDGKMIAFTSTKAGTKNIWIKQTTAGEAVQITRDEFKNERPIWSPNGEELAFFSTRGNQTGFWRIPILGGSPKLISSVDDGSSLLRFWSKTNLIYYESNHDIFAIDANSGQTKKITDFDKQAVNADSINVSPDEQQLTFITVDGQQWSIWTKKFNDDSPKKLFSAASEIKNAVWHPDNRRIFYSSIVDGTFQIFVTDINAAPPKQITSTERDSFVLDVASDGTKILYGSAKEDSDIWGFNLKGDKDFIVASDINSELWANVSPDGKSIAYQSIKNLSQGNNFFNGKILTRKLDSGEPPTEIIADGYLPTWSPDGQTIAFIRQLGKKHQLSTIKPTGGGQKTLAAEDISRIYYSIMPYNRIQTSDFSWSPDSTKIAYVSRRNGQPNIWLVKPDGSTDTQLTDNQDPKLNIFCPLWSSDGKRIAYTSKTGNSTGKSTYTVWLIDTETKNSKPVTQESKFLRLISWSTGNELILAATSGSETTSLQPEVSVLQVEIETGRMRQIAMLKDTYLSNIQLSPDKKNIAFTANREGKDNLWLMPATGGEAKRLTNNNDSRLYFSSLAWSPDNNSIFFGKQSRYSLLSMLLNFK